MSCRPVLEALEERALLSVSSVLNGTVLNLAASSQTPHSVLVRPNAANPAQTDVVADGVTSTFAEITQVNYSDPSAQPNTFTNRTPIAGLVVLGDGFNVVLSTAKGQFVQSGNGNNFIQDTAGGSTLIAGNGYDNIYGGPNDTIVAGSGTDIIYDILPGSQTITVAPHAGVDHLFIGPNTVLTGAQGQDHVAQFFVAGRTIGSGTLVQQGSTLYFTGNNNGDTYIASPGFGPGGVFVTYNLNDGTGYHFAQFNGVNQLANFGGAGADTFVNNTGIDDVQYGAGGSNILIGGFGQLDLEKAGGAAATNSFAFGRASYNDLNGSGTPNTTTTLLALGNHNFFRSNSVTDQILSFSPQDIVISLYPDVLGPIFPGTSAQVR